eukprot:562072-Rhodomonas_salina.1
MDTIIDAAQAIADSDHIQSQAQDHDVEGSPWRHHPLQRVTILKLGYFNRELTWEWSQPKTFRLKGDDKEGLRVRKLAAIHSIAQGKQLLGMNQNFLIMLQLAWLKAKGNNWQQECLAAILYSSQGVAEAVDGNFVSDVSCLLAQVIDTTVLSVHAADQNMEHLLLPLKQNFQVTTLGDFLNYMCVEPIQVRLVDVPVSILQAPLAL